MTQLRLGHVGGEGRQYSCLPSGFPLHPLPSLSLVVNTIRQLQALYFCLGFMVIVTSLKTFQINSLIEDYQIYDTKEEKRYKTNQTNRQHGAAYGTGGRPTGC